MILSQAEPYIDDYLTSEHLLFLDPAIKENADGVLRAFFQKAGERGASSLEALKAAVVEAVLLQDLGRLDLPLEGKRALPDLFAGFFGYLKDTGRFPAAGSWEICAEAVKGRFAASLRDDGTVRGETFKKTASDVGRNDPCPCGSGQKFKKCCGPLIGL
jgi:hypothetical protein